MRLIKILLAITILTGFFAINAGYAKPIKKEPVKKVLTAKVSTSYMQINKMVEYENYTAAENAIYNLLKQNSNNIDARALLIVSYAKQGKFDVAQSQLNAYLPKYPNNANLHYAQGIVNVKRQATSDMEYRENSEELIKNAVKEFRTAIKLNPKHYQAYNALGVISLNIGKLDKANGFFNKANDIDSTYATAIDNAGTVDYLYGNYDEARAKFIKALKLNPKSSTAYFHIAQVYDKKSMYSKALDALDHSILLNPNSSVAYNLRGEILKKQGNENAAIEAFKKSIAIRPENTKPYLNMATIYEKRFDNELAIANLKSAVAINTSLNRVKLHIGDLSLVKGDYNEALKYYGSLIGVEGYNGEALKGMANAYFAQAQDITSKRDVTTDKNLDFAYQNIERALKSNPHDLQLYLAKLKLAKLTKQEKVTQETLDKIISTTPTGINDVLAKGDAYLTMNKYKEAKETFAKSVVFAQSKEDYLFIAEILTYDKFYSSAKDILRLVLMHDPANEEATKNLQYIMTMEKQSESLYKDAKYLNKKDKNKVFAREYALKSLSYNPTSYDAALLSAKLCEKQKHYEEAADAYKIVAGLELKPKKIKKMNKKIAKLEKKVNKQELKYMKKDNKKFKKWQNNSTLSL